MEKQRPWAHHHLGEAGAVYEPRSGDAAGESGVDPTTGDAAAALGCSGSLPAGHGTSHSPDYTLGHGPCEDNLSITSCLE